MNETDIVVPAEDFVFRDRNSGYPYDSGELSANKQVLLGGFVTKIPRVREEHINSSFSGVGFNSNGKTPVVLDAIVLFVGKKRVQVAYLFTTRNGAKSCQVFNKEIDQFIDWLLPMNMNEIIFQEGRDKFREFCKSLAPPPIPPKTTKGKGGSRKTTQAAALTVTSDPDCTETVEIEGATAIERGGSAEADSLVPRVQASVSEEDKVDDNDDEQIVEVARKPRCVRPKIHPFPKPKVFPQEGEIVMAQVAKKAVYYLIFDEFAGDDDERPGNWTGSGILKTCFSKTKLADLSLSDLHTQFSNTFAEFAVEIMEQVVDQCAISKSRSKKDNKVKYAGRVVDLVIIVLNHILLFFVDGQLESEFEIEKCFEFLEEKAHKDQATPVKRLLGSHNKGCNRLKNIYTEFVNVMNEIPLISEILHRIEDFCEINRSMLFHHTADDEKSESDDEEGSGSDSAYKTESEDPEEDSSSDSQASRSIVDEHLKQRRGRERLLKPALCIIDEMVIFVHHAFSIILIYYLKKIGFNIDKYTCEAEKYDVPAYEIDDDTDDLFFISLNQDMLYDIVKYINSYKNSVPQLFDFAFLPVSTIHEVFGNLSPIATRIQSELLTEQLNTIEEKIGSFWKDPASDYMDVSDEIKQLRSPFEEDSSDNKSSATGDRNTVKAFLTKHQARKAIPLCNFTSEELEAIAHSLQTFRRNAEFLIPPVEPALAFHVGTALGKIEELVQSTNKDFEPMCYLFSLQGRKSRTVASEAATTKPRRVVEPKTEEQKAALRQQRLARGGIDQSLLGEDMGRREIRKPDVYKVSEQREARKKADERKSGFDIPGLRDFDASKPDQKPLLVVVPGILPRSGTMQFEAGVVRGALFYPGRVIGLEGDYVRVTALKPDSKKKDKEITLVHNTCCFAADEADVKIDEKHNTDSYYLPKAVPDKKYSLFFDSQVLHKAEADSNKNYIKGTLNIYDTDTPNVKSAKLRYMPKCPLDTEVATHSKKSDSVGGAAKGSSAVKEKANRPVTGGKSLPLVTRISEAVLEEEVFQTKKARRSKSLRQSSEMVGDVVYFAKRPCCLDPSPIELFDRDTLISRKFIQESLYCRKKTTGEHADDLDPEYEIDDDDEDYEINDESDPDSGEEQSCILVPSGKTRSQAVFTCFEKPPPCIPVNPCVKMLATAYEDSSGKLHIVLLPRYFKCTKALFTRIFKYIEPLYANGKPQVEFTVQLDIEKGKPIQKSIADLDVASLDFFPYIEYYNVIHENATLDEFLQEFMKENFGDSDRSYELKCLFNLCPYSPDYGHSTHPRCTLQQERRYSDLVCTWGSGKSTLAPFIFELLYSNPLCIKGSKGERIKFPTISEADDNFQVVGGYKSRVGSPTTESDSDDSKESQPDKVEPASKAPSRSSSRPPSRSSSRPSSRASSPSRDPVGQQLTRRTAATSSRDSDRQLRHNK